MHVAGELFGGPRQCRCYNTTKLVAAPHCPPPAPAAHAPHTAPHTRAHLAIGLVVPKRLPRWLAHALLKRATWMANTPGNLYSRLAGEDMPAIRYFNPGSSLSPSGAKAWSSWLEDDTLRPEDTLTRHRASEQAWVNRLMKSKAQPHGMAAHTSGEVATAPVVARGGAPAPATPTGAFGEAAPAAAVALEAVPAPATGTATPNGAIDAGGPRTAAAVGAASAPALATPTGVTAEGAMPRRSCRWCARIGSTCRSGASPGAHMRPLT